MLLPRVDVLLRRGPLVSGGLGLSARRRLKVVFLDVPLSNRGFIEDDTTVRLHDLTHHPTQRDVG